MTSDTGAPAASRTAAGVAWLRAAHQILDAAPLILRDPAVLTLLGDDVLDRLRRDPAPVQTPGARALRSHVVLRSRFAEDRLEAAVRRGVRRYIVLGAGYDTFIARQPEWAQALRVIEVDQPATQAAKRERLASAGMAVPDNVRFADVDFEVETILAGLRRHDVRLDEPTFFSWLGVTVYLTEPAIDAVFEAVAACPSGSEITFTFSQPRAGQPGDSVRDDLASRAAALGEPWLTYFEPDRLEEKLRRMGFRDVAFLTPADAATRYFSGRTDGLPAPRRTTIASATR